MNKQHHHKHFLPTSKQQYIDHLDRLSTAHYGIARWGLLAIERTKSNTYSVSWGSSIIAQGRIPACAHPPSYPLSIARAAIHAMNIDQLYLNNQPNP